MAWAPPEVTSETVSDSWTPPEVREWSPPEVRDTSFQESSPLDDPVVINESLRQNPLGISTTKGGGRAPLASFTETMVAPIEQFGESLIHEGIPMPKLTINKDDAPLLAAGKEVVNVASSIPEFFTSSLGIGAVAAGAVAPVITAGAFTVDLLYSLGKQAVETYKNWSTMSPAEKSVAVVDMGATGVFAGLTGRHTFKGTKANIGAFKESIVEQLPDVPRRFMESGEELVLRDELGKPVEFTNLTAAEVSKTTSLENAQSEAVKQPTTQLGEPQAATAELKELPVKEIGGQDNFLDPTGPKLRMYNLLEDITDAEGNILKSKGSTVGDKTLTGLGYKSKPIETTPVPVAEPGAGNLKPFTERPELNAPEFTWTSEERSRYAELEKRHAELVQQKSTADRKQAIEIAKEIEKVGSEMTNITAAPGNRFADAPPAPPRIEPSVAQNPVETVEPGRPNPLEAQPEDIVSWLESKKVKGDYGAASANPFPQIGTALYNTSIDIAIASVKAGRSIRAGIEEAIDHIKKNFKGTLDESSLREHLIKELIPPSKGSGLEDIYKIFEPSEKQTTPLGDRVASIVEAVRTGLSSKFRPLDKLAEDIAKAYGTVSRKGIAGIFEQLKGSSGRGEADIYRFDQEVSPLVKGSEKDFNAYMFLRRSLDRLTQDAATGEGRRKVAGYDTETLQGKLDTLESGLGKEKLDAFNRAADLYQQHMDAALRLQVESGRMSQEVYDLIKSGNQFYAPFKVMKYIEETSQPPGTGKRIDTPAEFTKAMVGIEDPNFKLGDMLGAARQSLLLSRILADKNNAMRRVAELATHDTEGRFIKRLDGTAEVPNGWESVNVFEDGKRVRYATNPDVAQALQMFGQAGNDIVSRTLSAFSVPFRAGATALNLPFQFSNLMADVPRQALVSKYGIREVSDLIRYPIDFIHAMYSSIAGDVFGIKNKLFLDFLDSGVAGATVQEHLTPNALRFQTPDAISQSAKLGKTALYTIPRFAAAIEQTSKVLGVKRAMRFENAASGAELARHVPEAITELRRFSGSPDFGRQGKWTEQARLNLLYMFFNARVQGAIADIGRLGGRDGAATAATTWFKVGTAIGLPTAYLYLLNNSDEYKKDYDQRPDKEKNNYWLIPKDAFITNENGEKMRDYWRIPKRESSKWIANMTESALNFADKKDPEAFTKWGVNMLEDISPVNIQGKTLTERAESIGASLNPVIKAPLEASTGRDMYRHRNIVPDSQKKASPEQQYTDRTPEVFKKLADAIPDVAPEVFRSPLMLENMTRNLTAGLITQFLPIKPIEGRSGIENQALMQRFQAAPYTDSTKFREEMASLEREAADEYLNRHRTAAKLIADNNGKSLDKIVPIAGKDTKLIRHVVDLWLAEKNGITNQERQLLALPVTQRAEFIAGQLKAMTPEQKKAAILNYARKRILTEGVAAQMTEALK